MAQLACGVAGGDAACDARGGYFLVVPGDADGRGVFEFGSVVLLGQYTVEAGLEESRGNALPDAERRGFSFVPGVSCWWDGQDVAGRARGGGIAEAIGGIGLRHSRARGGGGAPLA